jgi:hypothetical protein
MANRVGLPCYGCSNHREVPGNAHIECVAGWTPEEIRAAMALASPHGVKNGWFYFPFLFDPIWARDWHGSHAHEVPCEKFIRTPRV